MEREEEDRRRIPQKILNLAEESRGKLVPAKSKTRYEKEFDLFTCWMKVNDVSIVNEDVLLAYVGHLVSIRSDYYQ